MPLMRRYKPPAVRLAKRGYTLLELTISMPLLAMLMLGMASAIHLAVRSVPDSKTIPSAAVTAASALERFAAELNYATAVTSRTANAITFVTPDRTDDGVAETVTYRWAGTAGSPWVRHLQGGPDEVLLPSVQQLAMTYDAPVDATSGLPLLRCVNLHLQAPAGATSGIQTTIQVLNRPQLP